jgi:glycosyltransferase involved in cell wall biosynthesis
MFANFLESVEGYGVDEFRKHVASLNIQDVVDLREGVPMQEMPGILRSCDAGLIAYDRKLGADSLPNKLFEYMAAGLPTIAPEYSPEIRRILETEKCGVTADFENPSSVADAIVRIRQNPEECREMGRRAREAFNKRHNWEYEVRPLLDRIRDWYE